MRFRLRYFGLHLLASSVLLGTLLAVLYAGWYRWPGWYLSGAEAIAGVLVLVDVGMGPVATLVIANPRKPRRELARDIVLIAVMQLAALGYGAQTFWAARPLFYAFSGDQIELIAAAAIDDADLRAVAGENVQFAVAWTSRPRWVWVAMPQDPERLKQVLRDMVVDGKDISSRPQYYRPLAEAQERLRAVAHPLSDLSLPAENLSRLAALGLKPDSVIVVPMKGRVREGVMLFERAAARPLEFWPLHWTDPGKRRKPEGVALSGYRHSDGA